MERVDFDDRKKELTNSWLALLDAVDLIFRSKPSRRGRRPTRLLKY